MRRIVLLDSLTRAIVPPVLTLSRVVPTPKLLIMQHAEHFSFRLAVTVALHADKFYAALIDVIFEVIPLGLIHNQYDSVVHCRELLLV